METFAAPPAKLFLENHRHKLLLPITYLWCPHSHTTTSISNRHRHHLLSPCCFSSLHRRSILPVASSVTAASEPQALDGDEGIQTDTTEFKTFRVKFELKRECSFGQQFFVVGDDPMFGLWDPLNAVPLNWSEDHVWALEMDLPCHKVLKYKFILKGGDDYILWQPGPDRILQTWETKKTITVCEDWDNAELQTIREEDPVTNQLSESVHVLEEAENVLQLNGGEGESCFESDLESENGYFKPNEALSAEKPIFTPSTDKFAASGITEYPKAPRSSSIGINLDSVAAVPVLVPGMTPLPTTQTETEEASVSEAKKQMGSDSSLNTREPYLKKEAANAIDMQRPKEETENGLKDDELGVAEEGHEEKRQVSEIGGEVSVVENDFDWGRRTLQRFLMNLGLAKHNF